MKYKIILTIEANKIIDKDVNFFRNEEITTCAVYRLTNGTTFLVPFGSSTSAMFNSYEECLNFIDSNDIDEIRTGNRFEYIKDDMLNISETWESYVLKLSKKLKRNIIVSNDKEYLHRVNKDIMKYGKRNAEKMLYVEIGIFLCAVLKKIVGGEWEVRESNPGTRYNFFKPYIIDDENIEYSCWKQLAESFYENRKFDIIDFIERGSIFWNIDVSGKEIVKR